jgi:C1A family cysteine protease
MVRKIILPFIIAFTGLLIVAYPGKANSRKMSNNNDSANMVSQDSLLKIIKQQNENIAAFHSLQEDLTAKEVFKKSKSYLIEWITIGGLAILFVVLLGYFKIKDYIIEELKKKMDKEGSHLIKNESSKQINDYIQSNLHIDEIAKEIETKSNERLNELMNLNKKSFDEFVKSKQKDFQDFMRQLEESRQMLKGPLGEGAREEKPNFEKQVHASADYSSLLNPVRDQGNLGSSVGFAMAYTLEYYIFKQLNKKVILSPLFIYYHARKIAGTEKIDAGAFIKDAVKVTQDTGAVEEKEWPYNITKFAVQPPKKLDKSTHYFVINVSPVKSVKQLKNALSNYGPVIIGISIYESFLTNTGMVKMPTSKENVIGGHAISLVGFDDQTQFFKFKNSWGENWGENGYGYIPYDYMEKFSDEGYLIKSVKEISAGI